MNEEEVEPTAHVQDEMEKATAEDESTRASLGGDDDGTRHLTSPTRASAASYFPTSMKFASLSGGTDGAVVKSWRVEEVDSFPRGHTVTAAPSFVSPGVSGEAQEEGSPPPSERFDVVRREGGCRGRRRADGDESGDGTAEGTLGRDGVDTGENGLSHSVMDDRARRDESRNHEALSWIGDGAWRRASEEGGRESESEEIAAEEGIALSDHGCRPYGGGSAAEGLGMEHNGGTSRNLYLLPTAADPWSKGEDQSTDVACQSRLLGEEEKVEGGADIRTVSVDAVTDAIMAAALHKATGGLASLPNFPHASPAARPVARDSLSSRGAPVSSSTSSLPPLDNSLNAQSSAPAACSLPPSPAQPPRCAVDEAINADTEGREGKGGAEARSESQRALNCAGFGVEALPGNEKLHGYPTTRLGSLGWDGGSGRSADEGVGLEGQEDWHLTERGESHAERAAGINEGLRPPKGPDDVGTTGTCRCAWGQHIQSQDVRGSDAGRWE